MTQREFALPKPEVDHKVCSLVYWPRPAFEGLELRYLISLEHTRFVASNRKFAVIDAREYNDAGELAGWASVVFQNTIPIDETGVIEVWGDWEVNSKYGNQLIARSWIRHSSLPDEEIPEPDEASTDQTSGSKNQAGPKSDQ